MNDHSLPIMPLAAPWLPPHCAEAVKRQIETTFVGPGATGETFAARLAEIAGVKAAVLTASGTVALSVAARVLGLKPGDEVIVPAYGVISVINGFASIDLAPRLADIDPATGCLDPERLLEAITPRTKAVCFVNFGGSIGPEIDAVSAICRSRGIPLIEDAAWSLGRGSPGRKGGCIGEIAAASFSVPKLITTGQGGAVYVKSEEHREAAICAIDHGDVAWRKTNLNRGIGSNLRLSDVSAALGLAQLDDLDERIARKRNVYQLLLDRLGERLFCASDGDYASQYVVFVDDPEAAVRILRSKDIMATRQYRAYYEHPPYSHLRDRVFPGAEFWSSHALYLPFGIAMTEEDAERLGKATLELNVRFLPWSARGSSAAV